MCILIYIYTCMYIVTTVISDESLTHFVGLVVKIVEILLPARKPGRTWSWP